MGAPGPALRLRLRLLPLLLLLLAAGVGAQDEVPGNVNLSCPKDATRFKHLRKYVYSYEAEGSSEFPGTADSRSTTKISCKVELEVPQLCSFILKISQCTLEEAYGFSLEGKALLMKTKNSDEFAAAMSRYELRLAIPEGKKVVLYPEKDEPKHILNIKRGIISALLVPPETEEDTRVLFLDTVYGNCSSDFTVKARKGNTATEISIERNLETCEQFQPVSTGVSPLALIQGLSRPLSTLINSNQSCQYTLDPKRRHVSEATCQERHQLRPFSDKTKYGMMAQVMQTLKLEDTPKINSRFFDEGAEEVGLAFESTKSTSTPKEAEAVLKTLQDLQILHVTEQNFLRAQLFNQLVTELRGLDDKAVSDLLPKMMDVSSPITLQALIQCGQSPCYTHILQWLRRESANPLLVDVATYLIALIPEPSAPTLQEIFTIAKEQQSQATLYSLSHVVNNFHKANPTVTRDLQAVADYLLEQIREDCSGDEEHIYLILRIIGNIGRTMEQVTPRLKSSVLKCIKSPEPSLLVQKAAIQALRKMELNDEVRDALLQIFLNHTSAGEKRLAAYLMLMRSPSQSDVNEIIKLLPREQNEQVKNFVASHIANILKSDELYTQDLKELVGKALEESQLPTLMDFTKFSRNYQLSKSFSLPSLDSVSAKIEGNLIFDPKNYLPKESMLKTTLAVLGVAPTDLFEIGLEGRGFEPTVEALFGNQGFFPDSVNRALYWVEGQVPDPVSKVLVDHFGYTKDEKHGQDMVKGIMLNVQNLIKDLQSKEFPEARAYLQILGEELGFVRLRELQLLGRLLLNSVDSLRKIPQMIGETLRKGSRNDLFLHYIFMDNAFELPTGLGLQLHVSSSGIITPGVKAGFRLEVANMQMELVAKPSVSLEFVTSMGIILPEFAVSGVQRNTNFFHESGLEARVALKAKQLKFIIPSPEKPIRLFSFSNTLHFVSTTKTEAIPSLVFNKESWSTCKPFFPGLNYCIQGDYSNTSSTDSALDYPLTRDTSFVLELKPTGMVRQYSASATYELQREGEALVDTLKLVTQAEVSNLQENGIFVTFRYNRQKTTLSSEVEIPDFNVNLGTILRVSDESSEKLKSYKLTLDMQNKKITEITLIGHLSCNRKEEGKIKGVISIPRLQAEARSEIHTLWSPTKLLLQIDSSATAYGSTVSKKVAWRYDEEKLEFEWNAGTNVDTKKAASNFPVDLSDYPKSLQMYASGVLDQRVPQTDMTFRHMGSKLIVETHTLLQRISKNLPYTQNMQDHLSSLKELYLQNMGLPDIHLPENLFLKSDGRVKYTLNKNSMKIDIPLPFGGKSSKDLKMLETIRTPALNFKSVGVYMPPQEYQIPTFTIPKLYQLRIPLLGVLDLSTNIYSNLYNWSASYTGGNTSKDHLSLQSQYHIKATSVVDLLSYSVQGSGEATYDHKDTVTLACDGSLHHKFLDSNVKFSHVAKLGNNPASKCLLRFSASSAWGPQMSASVNLDSKKKQHLYIKEVKIDGQFRVSSFYGNGEYGLTYQRDPTTGQINGESNLKFNSTYIQGNNHMTGLYKDGLFTLTSTSDLQDGLLKNSASLKYENYELTVNSDTSGKYEGLVTSNKVDLAFSKKNVLLRSEYQAAYKLLRFFTLLSGSLTSQGLELNADILGTGTVHRGAHKATLKIGQDGISSSAITNVMFSPLVLENEMNAALSLSGASMKLTANGRYREHNAMFNLDGKAALTEISLGSIYQAMILDVDSKNVFSFKINREGLKLSNDMMGSFAEMKLDHSNKLNIAGLSLDFSSKLDNIYSSDKFYKQNFNLQLQPLSLITSLNNDLKFSALNLTNRGKLRLEPLKLSMSGFVRGAYQNNEVKHTYSISYADLLANYNANTEAKMDDTVFSHQFSTELAGLAFALDTSTNYNSEALHFSNVFHSAMAPFKMTISAHTNGDGKLVLWGNHTGKLYNKFLFKAEPLALTLTHDYKGSTSHHHVSGKSTSTALDHKVSVLLTLAEQTSTWKFKTQLNRNEYSQDIDVYNTKDKVGAGFNGQTLVDFTMLDSPIEVPFLLKEPVNVVDALELRDATDQPQEFAIVASVKYDKNLDVHTINIPFLKDMPEYFEKNRIAMITALETIQRQLKQTNIDQFMRQYREAMIKLPQQVNDYMDASNWEQHVSQAKEKLAVFTKNYGITENDLKIALNNAKINLNEILFQLQTYVIQLDQYIKDNYDLHDLKITIAKIIDQIIEKLKILDEHYHIKVNFIKVINDIYLFIEKIDLNKIGNSIASWVQTMDTKYQIRIQIQNKLQQFKTQIQNIDIQHFSEKLKQYIETVDVRVLWDWLRTTIPFQKIKEIIEHIKYRVKSLIEGSKVTEKINAFRVMFHKLIKSFEIDRHTQVLIYKLIELCHQYKLKETVQKLSNALQQVEIKVHFEKLVRFIDDTTQKLKALSFKNFTEEVNRFLATLLKKLKSFDYHQFIEEANSKIREVTQRINDEIQALELPQKAKALTLLAEDLKATLSLYLENLKNTKITFFFDWLKESLSSVYLIYMQEKFQETLEDVRDRIYQMDIQKEVQRYLSLVGQLYNTVVTYIIDWWCLAAKNLTDFAEQYSIGSWAENMKALVEQGFTVPEIQTTFGTMPAFEVSLRALHEATYQTPAFIVPLTDLRIPSFQINIKKLKEIKIPSKFSTPEFTVLRTFHVPSFTIDLVEIKIKIIRTIDQMLSSELQWPVPEVYLRDLKGVDIILDCITLPNITLPEFRVPEFIIPNLHLRDYQVPEFHIPEFQLPQLSHRIEVPAFGKLYSTLKIKSPLFTLDLNANIQNITSSVNNSEIAASITGKGVSQFELLNFHFQANAQLLDPKINPLVLKEFARFSNKYLKTEHDCEVQFGGNVLKGKSNTVAALHTDKNTLEFRNGLLLKINNQLTLNSSTKYSHKLNFPNLEFSSQADLRNEIKTLLEVGHIEWTTSGTGSWKWACPRFSDEGTQGTQISFTLEGPVTSFELSNEISSKHLKVNQSLSYECTFLNFSQFEIQSQVESQHVGRSVLTVKGTVLLGEGKAAMTGNHDAHLNGKVSGTLKNSLFFSARPFEMTASTNNEGNLKVSFPLKLTGKIDFLNNYALFLNPTAQQASWQASARFNQYKYNQNFSAGNNENSIDAHIGMNGEANLDFLNIPLTIPEMTLPYTMLKTPQVKNFSIWEKTGLKKFLKTTKQSFDLSVKTQYKKNKDMYPISLPLAMFDVVFNHHINSFIRQVEKIREKAFVFVIESYNEAKVKYDEYKVEKSITKQSRTFQIPGYTIPVVNIEASPFTVEMFPLGYVIPKEINTPNFTILGSGFLVPSYTLVLPFPELPTLRVPKFLELSLSELSIPKNIFIPALGNITYDFSFKSSVITLNANAGLYNQSDIVAHVITSSSSVFDALQYKLEGTSSLTRKRGLKLATAFSLSNEYVEGKHDSTISLAKKNLEVSVATTAKIHLPILRMNFTQELNGNSKSKHAISSFIKLQYNFNSPHLYSTAIGTVGHKFQLENPTSYFSIESSTKGDINGSILSREYSGTIASEFSTYLNSKSSRSAVKLQGTSKVDGILNFEVNETFAGEATFRRIYAIWEHNAKNQLQLMDLFLTSGNHASKATLELSPWKMSTLVQVRASQPNSLLDIKSLVQEVSLKADTQNQKAHWKSEVQVHSGRLYNNVQLSNDPKEMRLSMAGSLEGYLGFLSGFVLPVYDKSLWDLLKLNVSSSINRKQYLHTSTALVYNKAPNIHLFSLPVQELVNKFIIPGLKQNNLNSVLVTPTFHIPFTNLQFPSYTLKLSQIEIYKNLSTLPFDLNIPLLPKLTFPKVDVLTKYFEPEDSLVPFFEITVPESQLTMSKFTLPKRISFGIINWDLDEATRMIADFELPTTIMPEQTIEIPPIKFSVPAGIFIPSFGTLTARFTVASPLYTANWSSGLKNKVDHVETFLESTCSSSLQFLEYDLNVVATHRIENGALVCQTNGTFAHHDIRAEYKEDSKYKGLGDWIVDVHLDITSPTFTDFHLRYQSGENGVSSSVASPAIGTVTMDVDDNNNILKWHIYYQPQSSPNKTLSIFRYHESENSQIKVNWEEASKLLRSIKDKVPTATGAFYDCVNGYHQNYTGLDLRDASLKVKRSLQKTAEWAYHSAKRQIDEADTGLQRVARSTTGIYQQWQDKTQNLYQDLLALEGQADFQRLHSTLYDGLIGAAQKYSVTVNYVIESVINFLKFTRFQIPGRSGMYTGDELCTVAMREVAKVLSWAHSEILSGLKLVFSYFQDLMVKSELIEFLQIKLEWGELLTHLSQRIQKVFNDLQSRKATEMLSDLQRFLQYVFQEIEGKIKYLKEKKFTSLISSIPQEIGLIFNKHIPYIFKSLKENLCLTFNKLVHRSRDIVQGVRHLPYMRPTPVQSSAPNMVPRASPRVTPEHRSRVKP
ncbi:apolipoprotein B-100 [Sorex fumeus]|nr:apolipoprotein B-100 [Sorex fumeus]